MIIKTNENVISIISKSVLIMLIGIVFPLIYIFLPAIFIAESLKSNIFKAMGMFIGCCVMVALFVDNSIGFFILGAFGPIILIYNYLILNKYEVSTSVVIASVVFFISISVSLYNSGVTTDVINSANSVSKFIEMQSKLMNQDLLEYVSRADLVIAYNKSLQMLPSLIVLISLIVSYLTYLFTGRKLLRSGVLIAQPPSFIFFKIPRGIMFTFFMSSVILYFFKDNVGYSYNLIINNVLVVFNAILFFVGLSNLHFAMIKLQTKSFSKIFLTVGAFLIPMVSASLVLVGFLDTVFNFRKLPE